MRINASDQVFRIHLRVERSPAPIANNPAQDRYCRRLGNACGRRHQRYVGNECRHIGSGRSPQGLLSVSECVPAVRLRSRVSSRPGAGQVAENSAAWVGLWNIETASADAYGGAVSNLVVAGPTRRSARSVIAGKSCANLVARQARADAREISVRDEVRACV